MSMTRSLLTVALSTALLSGCGSKKEGANDKPAAAATKEGKAAAPTTPLSPAFFGKKPAPLGLLAKLAWGTPISDAKAKMPELFRDGDKTRLLDDPAVQGVAYGISFDKETKKLDRMYLELPAAAKAHVEAAWGPGTASTDSIGRPRTYWFDPDGGWRAYLEPAFGDEVTLVLHPYIPAAKLLGETPDGLGFAPQPILGATIEDLRRHFKDVLVEESAEEAAKKQAEVSKFAGRDLEKELGRATANARFELPPTEWEDFWTRVNFHWTDDGKVETVYFKLPFKAHPAAKDELRALFDKKWGAPTEAKEYGTRGDTIWVYRDKDPRIVVKEDTISDGWDVRISSRAK